MLTQTQLLDASVARSVVPFFVSNWQPVETLAAVFPVGKVTCHKGLKAFVMSWFENMNQFMDDYVFETLLGLFGQVGVEANCAGLRVAASPAGFHAADVKLFDFDSDPWFPLCNQLLRRVPNLISIPLFDDLLSLCFVCARTDSQHHAVVFQLDGWWLIGFSNCQQIPLAPDEVTFPFEILTGSLAFLLLQLPLLTPDPAQFRDRVETDRVQVHQLGRSDANAA